MCGHSSRCRGSSGETPPPRQALGGGAVLASAARRRSTMARDRTPAARPVLAPVLGPAPLLGPAQAPGLMREREPANAWEPAEAQVRAGRAARHPSLDSPAPARARRQEEGSDHWPEMVAAAGLKEEWSAAGCGRSQPRASHRPSSAQVHRPPNPCRWADPLRPPAERRADQDAAWAWAWACRTRARSPWAGSRKRFLLAPALGRAGARGPGSASGRFPCRRRRRTRRQWRGRQGTAGSVS